MKAYQRPLIWIAAYTALFVFSLWLGRLAGGAVRSALAQANRPAQQAEHGQVKHSAQPAFRPEAASLPLAKAQPAAPAPEVPGKQRNILVVGVDDLLASQPELQSVWLVLFLNDSPHLMLVPIYPSRVSGVSGSATRSEKLAGLFSLDSESAPAPKFLQALKDMDLWWSGYLLVDQQALAQAIVVVSTDPQDAGGQTGTDAASLPGSEPRLDTAFPAQIRLAQEMCRQSAWLSTANAQQILDTAAHIYPHMRTDLDLELVVAEIKNAIQHGGGVSCEFPTLLADARQP